MNVLDGLKRIENESIDLVITSPPYWNLRNYPEAETNWPDGWKGELGSEQTPQDYISHLMLITNELKRVLKPSGTLWWNCNDTYASGGGKATEQSYNREIGSETGQPDNPAKAELRNKFGKSKLLIPEQFAVKMVYEGGWLLRNTIIWEKPSSMPGSFTDRMVNSYEPVFFFVKSKEYYFNMNSIRAKKTYPNAHVKEICNEIYIKAKELRNQNKLLSYDGKIKAENAEMMGSPRARQLRSGAGSLQEFLVAMRQVGKLVVENHPELTEKEKEYISWFSHNQTGNIDGSTPRDVWSINTEPLFEEHSAAFPGKLVRKCLLAGCPEGGSILDPFMGSGTSAKIGLDMNLNVFGCEISSKYIEIIERRCKVRERQQLNQLEYKLIANKEVMPNKSSGAASEVI